MNEVKRLRDQLGMSRETLARLIDRSSSMVEQWEAEPTDEMRAKLRAIAESRGIKGFFVDAPKHEKPSKVAVVEVRAKRKHG